MVNYWLEKKIVDRRAWGTSIVGEIHEDPFSFDPKKYLRKLIKNTTDNVTDHLVCLHLGERTT